MSNWITVTPEMRAIEREREQKEFEDLQKRLYEEDSLRAELAHQARMEQIQDEFLNNREEYLLEQIRMQEDRLNELKQRLSHTEVYRRK